jgi:hypothetical protein
MRVLVTREGEAQLAIRRKGAATTNFGRHLPESSARLASEALKDPYLFDFLGLGDEAHERDIEGALIRHITPADDMPPSNTALPPPGRQAGGNYSTPMTIPGQASWLNERAAASSFKGASSRSSHDTTGTTYR